MLQRLLQRAAVAAADDQHEAHRAMRQDRHMDEHLVVEELVALGGLNDAVEGQPAAEGPVLEDQHLLLPGIALAQHPVTPPKDAESDARSVDLFHPFGPATQ